MIVPTLRVGTPSLTLCVKEDAERPELHSHAERGNDLKRSKTSRWVPDTCWSEWHEGG
jgi:hypothetical protein